MVVNGSTVRSFLLMVVMCKQKNLSLVAVLLRLTDDMFADVCVVRLLVIQMII